MPKKPQSDSAPEIKPESLADALDEIRHLMELNGENVFKARAFDKASDFIRAQGDALDWITMTREETLTDQPGIGKGLAEVIGEIVRTGGKSSVRDELAAKLPEGLVVLSQVPGLGPKKARQVIDELGIKTWGELEYACRENRLANLKGFGEKAQAKILTAVQHLNQNAGRLRLPEAQALAAAALADLRARLAPDVVAEVVGEVRRSLEIVERIEILVGSERAAGEAAELRAALNAGEARALPVDLHFCGPGDFASESVRLSSSAGHWARLQERVGLGLGLGSGEAAAATIATRVQDETAFYAAMGLPWIPPECREDLGEVALALRPSGIDSLITLAGMRGAFHFHSTYSDGVLSLEEVVGEANRRGWEYIGISDHSQSAFYAQGLKAEALERERIEIEKLRRKFPKIEIFWGIESDILADGSLDYDDATLEHFDFVIASVHSRFQMGSEEMTARILRAIDHPKTTMIGHLTGRILLGRKGYEIDAERVLRYAAKKKVIIELNASPARLDLDWRFGALAAEIGLMTSVNPDAHDRESFDDLGIGVTMARKGLFTADRVLNTRPASQVKKWLERREF